VMAHLQASSRLCPPLWPIRMWRCQLRG
jgi:hypothetical protein